MILKRSFTSETKLKQTLDFIYAQSKRGKSFHGLLDANFYEDDNSTMNKNAFNNLSIINKMILSLMKLAQPIIGKSSIRSLRKRFSWATEDNLAKVLNAFDDETLLEALSDANKK